MKKKVKVLKKSLIGQIIVPFVFSVSLLMVGYFIAKPAVKGLLITDRRQMVMEMVNNNYNLLEEYNEHVKKGDMTLSQAQVLIIDDIRHQRYGRNRANYFWIQDYEGHFIYHPSIGSSTPVNPQRWASMQKVALQIAELVKKQNQGYISYDWHNSQNDSPGGAKETYAKGYKPWGWVVCTGFLLTDIYTDLQQVMKKVMVILFSFLGCMLMILSFILFRNYRNLQKIMLADNELKKSETRFRRLVGHIDNGVMIFENNKTVFANEQFCKIFDLTDQDALHFNLQDYLPGWEKERVKIILNAPAKPKNIEFGTWLRLKNQTEKYVNLRFSFDTDTDIAYTYLIVQDITEQRQSLTTINILSENLVQSNESIVITDLNGSIEYVNPGFEKVTGYTLEEVKGKTPRLLNSGKMSHMIFEDLWKTITRGEIWRGEMLNKKKDGSLFWESTIIFPIKNQQNEIIKYSSIKTDISYNKRIEKELVAAKDKAEENERLKTAFLNNVSHEVRTPLNAIYGFTQVLKNDFATDEDALHYLKIIEQNSDILLRLFEDILDVSCIESRSITLNREDVPLKGLLLKIVSRYNAQLTVAGTKPVEIIVDEDNNFEIMELFTDRKRITQIFDKLISNAVKFTNEGQIKISYNIYPENITFYISDTGVGIPDQEKEQIFNSFSHGDKMYVSLHKGLGLGLNIAKLLVELLGGKLTFTSDEGKGTTFSFTFPTTDLKNYTLNGTQVISYKHTVRGKNILIAEDNNENFKYFEALLAPLNNIIRAQTGLEAVTLIEKGSTPPDIILMDILMPDMDGVSASKLIRKIRPSVPIVAITAIGSALSGSESSVFDSILTKPVSAQLLIGNIHEVLNNM